MRRYEGEQDYWLLRQFLRDAARSGASLAQAWPLYRFDYWRWHPLINIYGIPLEDAVLIWEEDGRIVAFANIENFGEAFAHFDLCTRTDDLEV